MKKKLASIASAAAASAVVAAFSANAFAIAENTVIDFEDGDCSFVYLNEDEGADHSILSVEEYEGSKQLKVDVQDHTAVPKVWFDLDKITDRSNAVNITYIEMDLTFVPKNSDEAIGWAGGVIGTSGEYGKQVDPAWSQGDWSCEDEEAYNPGGVAHQHISRKFLLPSQKYTETGVSPFFGLMRWATESDYVIYIDNITLLDKESNPIPVGFAGAAPAPETPAVEEAPAAEEAPAPAPASDSATTSTSTGNTAAASIAAVMAMAGAMALVSRRK